ncbi:MAG: chloride channel protein [Actinomyces bowdenii]|nr:chloride channel protein [Actinomyces bowdenii]
MKDRGAEGALGERSPAGPSSTLRVYGVAAGYGAVAGAVTAVTFALMKGVQHLIWDQGEAWWYTAAVILVGGALIAWLRPLALEVDLDQQLDPGAVQPGHWRKILVVGLSAVIAVGFGGAIGPEAGLLAVVAELSIIIRDRIARSQAEARLITEAGSAAALSGFYGSPPVGAMYLPEESRQESATIGRLPVFCASLSGFAAFVLVWRLLGMESHPLELPEGRPEEIISLLAVVPALVGAALGVGYLLVRYYLGSVVARLGSVRVQTLVGSVVLAVVLACWPLLRFSGHDDFGVLISQAQAGAWGVLLAIGAAKVAATALCLASGWRGGDFFPLMFAGGGVGAAMLALVPSLGAQAAMVAGMAAATTVGVRKPVAVFVLLWFLVPEVDVMTLVIACVTGILMLKALPDHPALAGRGHGSH